MTNSKTNIATALLAVATILISPAATLAAVFIAPKSEFIITELRIRSTAS